MCCLCRPDYNLPLFAFLRFFFFYVPPRVRYQQQRFLTVLVTPKLNFSLQVKPSWKVADDIDQDEVTVPPLPSYPPVAPAHAVCTAAVA